MRATLAVLALLAVGTAVPAFANTCSNPDIKVLNQMSNASLVAADRVCSEEANKLMFISETSIYDEAKSNRAQALLQKVDAGLLVIRNAGRKPMIRSLTSESKVRAQASDGIFSRKPTVSQILFTRTIQLKPKSIASAERDVFGEADRQITKYELQVGACTIGTRAAGGRIPGGTKFDLFSASSHPSRLASSGTKILLQGFPNDELKAATWLNCDISVDASISALERLTGGAIIVTP